MSKYTEFMDMYSGGSRKLDWECIYIELPVKDAIEYFKMKFNRDPDNRTCPCCGRDYYVSEYKGEPEENKYILIIRKSDINTKITLSSN